VKALLDVYSVKFDKRILHQHNHSGRATSFPRLSCTLPEQLAISHQNQSLHALMDQVLF